LCREQGNVRKPSTSTGKAPHGENIQIHTLKKSGKLPYPSFSPQQIANKLS